MQERRSGSARAEHMHAKTWASTRRLGRRSSFTKGEISSKDQYIQSWGSTTELKCLWKPLHALFYDIRAITTDNNLKYGYRDTHPMCYRAEE